MKQITGINHVEIRVRSLAVTREFYEKLGFEFIEGPVGPEPVAVMIHPCGINMNFILNASKNADSDNVLMDRPTKQAGYTHVALEVSDLESVERQLGELEIPITGDVELPTGARFIFVRDPDRNVIEFHRPAPS